jgi:hypothetical protein
MTTAIFPKVVLWASVVWGVVMLGAGILASFTIGSQDTFLTLTGFALIFMFPIASSITARWMPRVTGIVLLLSAIAAVSCISQSWADVLQILSRIYLWPHMVFGVLFLRMNRIHGSSEAVAGEEPKS